MQLYLSTAKDCCVPPGLSHTDPVAQPASASAVPITKPNTFMVPPPFALTLVPALSYPKVRAAHLVFGWTASNVGSSLLALELFDGHRVEGSYPTHPMLAQRHDLLSDELRGRVFYDFQS